MRNRLRSPVSVTQFAALLLWGIAVSGGLLYALVYEFTPAKSESALERWPADSACELSGDCPTLVMFVHPHCPCSRASLNELAVLLTRCQGRVRAQVLFYKPDSVPDSWVETDLWDSAKRIPGVETKIDVGGAEQNRFKAHASGEVFVYLPDGNLLFHGGITVGRGHAGDNAGRLALESYLLHGTPPSAGTPVFGCSLDPPESTNAAKRESP